MPIRIMAISLASRPTILSVASTRNHFFLEAVGTFLSSDKLDTKLVKCAVLAEATPSGLAAFAQQGSEQQALAEKLLADDKLMKEMLIAGGATGGSYGRAMQIYAAIQQARALVLFQECDHGWRECDRCGHASVRPRGS